MYPIEKSLRGYILKRFVINEKVTYYIFEEDYGLCSVTIYVYPEENYRAEWFAFNSRGETDDLLDDKDKKLIEDTVNQIVKEIKNEFYMEQREKVKEIHKDLTDRLEDVCVGMTYFAPQQIKDYRNKLREQLKKADCYDEKTDSFIYPIEAIREFNVCSTEGHIVIN